MMVSISLYATHDDEALRDCALEDEHTLTVHKAEKLQTLITAAKIVDVEPIWTTLFAKVRNNSEEKE